MDCGEARGRRDLSVGSNDHISLIFNNMATSSLCPSMIQAFDFSGNSPAELTILA